jgi:aldehyde:ferredoxin oxidoreductase
VNTIGGTIVHCDLESGAATSVPDGPEPSSYLGGRGLGVALVARLGDPIVSPLDPAQPFVIAAGPLTGTAAPSSGRFAAVAPSPLTGAICDSNAGGRFGVRLRQAGVEALVLRGRAPEWSVVMVEGGAPGHRCPANPGEGTRVSVRVEPLSRLWPDARPDDPDLVWSRTIDGMRRSLGSRFSLLVPSVAGRKGSYLGSLRTDDGRNLGRGGLGAALAAKNVFAVALAGHGALPVADPERFSFLVYEAEKQVSANPVTSRALPQFGTAVLMQLVHHAGALPGLNYTTAVWPGVDRICGETVQEELVKGRRGCFGCRIRCTPRVERRASDGCRGDTGPEYETLWALGAAVGVDDLEVIQEANRLCGEYGLDTISVGATIACAMELCESGALGRSVHFGDGARLLQLVQEIGTGRDFGLELAHGAARFAARYGHPEKAMHVKGLEMPAYDPRGMHGQGLAYATSNRGACHLRGNMLGPEILGIPKLVDRFETVGKSSILLNLQHLSAVFDSASICKFAGLAFGEEVLARLLSAATGEALAAQDLLILGERIWNLERLWNNAAGFTRADDTLPARILQEPLADGPSADRTFDLDPMLDEYYRARGWDVEGVPSSAKVAALGLVEEVALLSAVEPSPGAERATEADARHSGWYSWRPAAVDEHLRRTSRRESPSPAVDRVQGGRHLRAVP